MVKKSTPIKNFYTSVQNLLKQGLYPAKIARTLKCSRQRLNYYISSLKRQGALKKVSIGVWEFDENKVVKKSTHIDTSTPYSIFTQEKVRGHGFMFKLALPEAYFKANSKWLNRGFWLDKWGIEYKTIGFGRRMHQIVFKRHKVWLSDRHICIFAPEFMSYFTDTAKQSKEYAISDFLDLVKGLEKYLHAALSFNGKYRFKVRRQHYGLLNNALARQYNRERKKLYVANDRGFWLVIDASLHGIPETEQIHPETSDEDTDKVVAPFFNYLKSNPSILPELRGTVGVLVNDTAGYRKEIRTHIEALQKLGVAVEDLVKLIRELKK